MNHTLKEREKYTWYCNGDDHEPGCTHRGWSNTQKRKAMRIKKTVGLISLHQFREIYRKTREYDSAQA